MVMFGSIGDVGMHDGNELGGLEGARSVCKEENEEKREVYWTVMVVFGCVSCPLRCPGLAVRC